MFGLIIRGVFLVGIVGWYSTSLWKMIDDYWKDQFKRYLDQEFQKNPHMRDDVIMHDDKQGDQPGEKVADKSEIPVTDSSCSGPECTEAAGAADSMHPREGNTDAGVVEAKSKVAKKEKEEGETGKKKKEVARPVVVDPAPAFQADRGRDTENRPRKIRMMQDEHGDSRDSQTSEEPKRRKKQPQQKHRPPQPKKEKKSPVRKRQKTSKKPQIGVKTEEESRQKNPRRIPSFVLTNQDFETYQKEHPDGEFDEFDEDEDERNPEDSIGIRVEDLPFKPAIDIYDLGRVSEEEFCPLTLDDDPSCEETRPWPY